MGRKPAWPATLNPLGEPTRVPASTPRRFYCDAHRCAVCRVDRLRRLAVRPAVRADETASAGSSAAGVKRLLAKYCLDCHSGSEPKGDLRLDDFRDAASVAAVPKVWLEVVRRLRDEEMPPEDKPQPSADERNRLAGWIEGQLAAAERNGPREPGRVTLRRLNRAEYANTIRDLLGIDFKGADDFPSDDVGYGFDNIGDVLSLPPLLLEKYLTAAQAVADLTIVTHPQPKSLVKVDARQAAGRSGGQPYSNTAWQFPSNGELFVNSRTSAEGTYQFKVTAFGQQAGDEPARMSLRVDGNQIGLVDVPAVEQAPQTCAVDTKLSAGDHRFTVAFVNDYYNPKEPNPANRDRNLVVIQVEVTGPVESVLTDLPAAHRRIIPHEPGADGRREYAGEILARVASRAFRRPATTAEVERLVKLYESAESREHNFAQGIQLALQAILVSPHFLFRVELDPESLPAGSIRALSDYELASRLSYFLWSSMPDDELFAAAAAGTLHQPAVLTAQARRMLADAKSRALVDNFAGQWLQLRI